MYDNPNQPQQPYGQPPYGQPGQSPYEQPQQPPYPYGQPQQPQPPQPQQPPYPYGQPQQPQPPQPQQPPYPYGQPYEQQPPYPPPPPAYEQPGQKKRGRSLWKILAIVAGVLVLLCVAGFAILALVLNNSPAKATAQQYYDAIQGQDYNKAYSYLDPSNITVGGQPITQQSYVAQAQIRDTQKGKVSSYSITSVNLNSSSSSGSTASITVSVTRNGTSYDVHLGLQQEGNNWKIVSIDDI